MEQKKGSSYLKQASILVAAGLIVRFIGFLYRLPLTALWGDTGNAYYAAGYQVYNFLLILSSAGLPAAIAKMVSERIALGQYQNAHRVFQVALLGCGVLSFVFGMILFFAADWIADTICQIPDSYYALVTLSPTIFVVGIMSVFRGYFQGMNTMVPTALSQIAEQIFNAVFSVVLAYFLVKHSVALAAAGGTAGTGIGAVAGLGVVMWIYRKQRPKIRNNIALSQAHQPKESAAHIGKVLVGTAFPIILGTAIYSITNLADMSMVMGRLADAGFDLATSEVLYGQLQGKYVVLTTMPVAISTAMATAAVPTIAASAVLHDKAAVERKINMAIKIAMIVSIPAAVGMGVLAQPILSMLFPTASEGGDLLMIGSVSILFLALSQIVTGTLQGIGKVHVPAINAAFGAVVKIILNYVLIAIPVLNVKGAVIATIFCYVVASLLNLRALQKATGFTPDFVGAIWKPAVAAAVMGIVCFGLYRLISGLGNTPATLVTIVVCIGVYAAVLLKEKGLTEEEILAMPMGGRILHIAQKFHLMP